MIRKINQYTILICIAVAVIGLAVFAILGFYNRYWADDWCYNNDFKHQGVIRAVGNYFATGENAHRGYSTNRYSLTLFGGLLYLPGIFGTQILASLTILLWLGGLLWTARNINRYKSFSTNTVLLLGSCLLLFYTFYLSPHRFQILYWRSGVLPYSWAIIFGLAISGLITSQLTREQPSKNIIIAIAPVSFLAGGFSEIGCVFLLSGFTLLLLVVWWEKRNSRDWATKTYSSILTAWIFLLMAMVTLALSPSNERSSGLNMVASAPARVPLLALQFASSFIVYSFRGLPLPHVILFTSVAGLGFLSSTTHETNYDLKKSAWIILITILITFLLVVAVQAPTAYFYAAPPGPRGESISRFALLTGWIIIAWMVGATVLPKLGKLSGFLSVILLLIFCIYTARATINIYNDLPGFLSRAQAWDERNDYINSSIEQGMKQIEIKAIDTSEINTRDILRSRSSGKWVRNACGVKYYNLKAMRIAP